MIDPLTKRRKDGTPYLRPDNIEALLPALAGLPRDALVERDEVRGAYNSALYFTPRQRMLQDWANTVAGMMGQHTVVEEARAELLPETS